MPACPATPAPAACRGWTGRWRIIPTRRSWNWAPTTCCAACRPAVTEKNLRAILATLQKDHVPVLLTGMQAQRNLGAGICGGSSTPSIRAWPRNIHVIFYPFILDGVALNPKLNQADGMHPNPAGVKIIVARILPDVKKAGRQVPATKNGTDVPAASLGRRLHAAVAHHRLCARHPDGGDPGQRHCCRMPFLFAFLFPNYFRAIFGEGTINPAFLPRYAALHAKGEDRRRRCSPTACSPGRWRRRSLILVLALVAMPLLVRRVRARLYADPGSSR